MGFKKRIQAAHYNFTISQCEVEYFIGSNSGYVFPFNIDGSGPVHLIRQHTEFHIQNLPGECVPVKQNHFIGLLTMGIDTATG